MTSVIKLEEWKVIPSNNNYEVSNQGNVRNIATGKILKTHLDVRGGYVCVKLWRGGITDGRRVHRLVCEAFNGAPPEKNMDCAHWDGNRLNNAPENLRWATRKQNEADKVRHGKDNSGQRNGMAKISDDQAKEIKQKSLSLPRSSGGKKLRKGAIDNLVTQYGISKAHIKNIIHGKRRIS